MSQKPPASKAKRLSAAAAIAAVIAMPAEGLRQWAYHDPVGILTVCWGATGDGVVAGRKYSLAECQGRLQGDMLQSVAYVERCAPGLPEHVLAAFGDAVFNLGPDIVCNTNRSTAARLLAQGRVEDACRQLPRWNKAKVAGVSVELPGLTKRRAREMQLCLTGRL